MVRRNGEAGAAAAMVVPMTMAMMAGARIATAAGAVAGVLRHPVADGVTVAVTTTDLINRIDRCPTWVITNDAAVIVAVVTGARFRGGDKADTGNNSEDGDDLFHRDELEFSPSDWSAEKLIQAAVKFF